MFLYFNGCSHTKGSILKDRLNNAFPALVGKHFNADFINDAESGSSNDGIVKRTFSFLQNNKVDYGIILMTHCMRMDLNINLYPTPSGKRDQTDPMLHTNFYKNYYDDRVGATNFYKNRYMLEKEFISRGIPLILMQFFDVPDDKVFKKSCSGESTIITKRTMEQGDAFLGRWKNRKYFYHEDAFGLPKKVDGHFNVDGHRKIAYFIIRKIDSH